MGFAKRTSDLAEGLRKLVAGALLGYSDNVTKALPSPSVIKRTTLGSRLSPGHGKSPGSKRKWIGMF